MAALNFDEGLVRGINARLTKPLVLIGLMGSGKSRLGKALAEALGLDFIDSDDEIEKASGMAIGEIFSRFGEEYFRDGERRVMRRLLDGTVRVIATGGGAVMSPPTAELVWNNSVSIWIRADLSVMIERTARNDRRPLLKDGDPETVLRQLMDERYATYTRADITVDSKGGPVDWNVGQALEKLDSFLRGRG